MKTIFIPTKIKSEVNAEKIRALKLPENIAIAYSIQYKNIAEKVKLILSKTHKLTAMAQVLGCSRPKFPKATQAVLLISSGQFHGVSLAAETGLPIYILESSNLRKISKEEIETFKKRKHAAYMKFLNSEKIGILVSTKPGQQNLKAALELKTKLKNKKSYLFINNELFSGELENFNIESWINTGCPRLDFDNPAINIADLNSRHPKDIL
jgi:2-(3-amino-3-carboxypropyl)histidine synthase